MHRITPIDSAFRAFHGASRMTVNQGDDGHMLQEMFGGLFAGESRKKIEFISSYGFTAAILPKTEQQQGGGGGSQGGSQGAPMMAEALVTYLGGNRSVPIASAIDDRRHRPYNFKPGESAQYDDQQQMTYIKRDGLYLLSHLKSSLRHIKEKQKQQRPPSQGQQQGAGGQQQGGQQQQQDPKHEGEPTAEVLCEKGKITISADDKVIIKVGGKDKIICTKDGIWLIGKVYLGVDSEGETGVKVETSTDVPSKQTYAKV